MKKAMKAFRFLLSGLSLLILAAPPSGGAFAYAGERVVRVGVYDNAPKLFVSETGKPAGIFIDIIEHIAAREGWTLRYVKGDWAQQLQRLKSGELDIMPDVAYTAERARLYSFNREPALSSWFQVYGRKGSRIQSILDLRGKRVSVLENSVQQEAFLRMVDSFGLHITVMTATDYGKVFEMASRGEADAAVANHFYGALNARKFGLEDTAVVFSPSALYFASQKGANQELLDVIDNHLRELKKDPQSAYYASLKRWTTEEVRFDLPGWIKTAGIIAGLVLIMSIAGSMVLKHQVNVRTRELRLINQEMEKRIAERTEELADAMEKAQAADRTKSAFLATMSHELRTPLNSIIGFTGMVLQGLAGPLNDEQAKQLGMVRSSARHLLDLINDILDISKIEAGQLKISSDVFDLKKSVEKALQIVSPLAGRKGLGLTCEIGPGIGPVRGDQRRLEQIVMNLLTNAVKFTERGEVRLVCRSEGDAAVLIVRDTGIGINAEDLEAIFSPFSQVDTGITRVQEGTGLGLTITKKLVEMMNGEIRVESVPGQGSIFTVTIPVNMGGTA